MSEYNGVRDSVIKLIYASFDSEGHSASKLDKSEETVLFGHGAVLDSFELVGLILAIERKITQEFAIAVTLANEKAMSQKTSPFRSVAALADYAAQCIEEGKRG